jgi:hypothetical protein
VITLETRVLDLSSSGYTRPAGAYICVTKDGETLGRTLDEEARPVSIVGAGSYCGDWGGEIIEILPKDRAAVGLTAVLDADTEVAVLGLDHVLSWVKARNLDSKRQCVIVPEVSKGHWFLVPMPFNFRLWRQTPGRYAIGTQPTMARICLKDRKKAFTTVAGVLSV